MTPDKNKFCGQRKQQMFEEKVAGEKRNCKVPFLQFTSQKIQETCVISTSFDYNRKSFLFCLSKTHLLLFFQTYKLLMLPRVHI